MINIYGYFNKHFGTITLINSIYFVVNNAHLGKYDLMLK